MTITGIIVAFCYAMTIASCAYQALVIFAALHFRGTPDPPLDFTPPVSVFKPLHGLDRDLYQLLAEYCTQDYPEYELLFAVADPADPATAVVRQLQNDF